MAEFKTWKAFRQFEERVRYERRYVWAEEDVEFLQTLLATGQERTLVVDRGAFLWRAQVGCDWGDSDEDPGPSCYGTSRMKPRPRRAPEGRANPKGIPYLYLATERDTAMSELRPSAGSYVSVAQFVTLRQVRIIDSSEDARAPFFLHTEPAPQDRTTYVWADIDRAFSRPVTRSDDAAEYVPTQVVAEYFKANGYDGIAYQSGLGKGHNLALFDVTAADQINGMVFQVRKIDYVFEDVCNPYWISKYLKDGKFHLPEDHEEAD
ncbi:MAG: hypothetical protein AMXMBFR53_19770 [Gemmatimonadota bacterium]